MTTTSTPEIDNARVEAFAERLMTVFTDGLITLMVDLADRTGLLAALAEAPGTSSEIADRAGLTERYVRECLGALVTSSIVDYEAAPGRYTLPAEHALCLTGGGSLNLSPTSRAVSLLATHVPAVATAFRDGGGVPYEAFRPEFTAVMDGMSRGLMDGQLLTGILPVTGDLRDRLDAGIRVADIGCGTGHTTTLLARAHPRSTFVGYDLAEDAVEAARAEAREFGLSNVEFRVHDVAQLPLDPPFDAVFAFDTIHDQVDPVGVLVRVHAALAPGGRFVMMDTKAASRLEDNIGNPLAPLLYAVSTLHCMTVSLAHDGAGLGTVWGEQLACRMLADAGFVDITVHDVPDDPLDSLYLARKP